MYDPKKKKSTKIVLALIMLIGLVFAILDTFYSYKWFQKLPVWFFYGIISKTYITLTVASIALSALMALLILLSFIQCCCKNSTGCCGPSVYPMFCASSFIFPLICPIGGMVLSSFKERFENGSKDSRKCSRVFYDAYKNAYNEYKRGQEEIMDFFYNANWDEYCQKPIKPVLILALVGLLVGILIMVVALECCCFSNKDNLSQGEDNTNDEEGVVINF